MLCQRLFLPLFVSVTLTGCVAAAVPVLAGGAVAHTAGRHRSAPKAIPATRTETRPVPVAPLAALPERSTQMRAGTLYQGALPAPDGSPAARIVAPQAPASSAQASSAAGATWSDVGHHVAANPSPEHSVLLVRGSPVAAPRWLSCGDKPRAVLASAATLLDRASGSPRLEPSARAWLDSLAVMSVKTVVVAGSDAEAAAVKTAFAAGGLAAPTPDDTLFVAGDAAMLPAVRAAVGGRFCVVALAGRAGADFPYELTPATTSPTLAPLWGHGWFLFTDPAN